MNIFALSGFSGSTIAMLLLILWLSAVMSGLSGFGFSAIGAICLWLLPPTLAVPLLMALSSANQMMSLRQIRADMKPLRQWWPQGPAPFIAGGLIGVPIGLWLLHSLPTPVLMVIFGAFLVAYAAYSMATPANPRKLTGGWALAALVGMAGGVIGGFTAFPGAAVVVWIGRLGLPKKESRAIVQPYIFAMQMVSLAMLTVQHSSTFSATFWSLFALTIVAVLPGTLLGVYIYKSLSDINFRRVSFSLLGTSGLAILTKGIGGLGIATGLLSMMSH
ncbi:sulfite exporter TauE/SafE family protein [Trinickia symbiotica]|nr:sulfite exporter TauE/SafE family protein [Trinickia symbiotica]